MRWQYAVVAVFNVFLLYATYELYLVLEHHTEHQGAGIKASAYTGDELLLQYAADTFRQQTAQDHTATAKISSAQTVLETVPAADAAHFLPKTGATPAEQPHAFQSPLGINAAIILFCFNRTEYLTQTLDSLAALDGLNDFHIIISQDGNANHVAAVVQKYGPHGSGVLAPPHTASFLHIQRERVPLLRPDQPGHAWLSQHYKFGLDALFLDQGHSHAIIIEDDMLFSPDFLKLFKATAPLLEQDPSLWCVSTWNDNGLRTFEWEDTRLFRTSYFPGLGWMMRRELWLELGPHWPLQNWDHWMRLETTAKGRECIVPEVNRNRNIGEEGANMHKREFKRYLSNMGWYQGLANETSYGDLRYLMHAQYQRWVEGQLAKAQVWDWKKQRVMFAPGGGLYLLPYLLEQYAVLARQLKSWPFPRGHFQHALYVRWKGSVFWLADKRFCTLLSPDLRTLPHPALRAVKGAQSQSCDAVCTYVSHRFVIKPQPVQ